VVRDYVREGPHVIKGGLQLLYAIPKNVPAWLAKGYITGTEYVSSACPSIAVNHAGYRTLTMVRGKGQSLNCSLLDAQHRLPWVSSPVFRERLSSLLGNTQVDATFNAGNWAQFWLESMPPWEYAEFMAKDPDHWGGVYQSDNPRHPEEFATKW
jgi:hypothetical protein